MLHYNFNDEKKSIFSATYEKTNKFFKLFGKIFLKKTPNFGI